MVFLYSILFKSCAVTESFRICTEMELTKKKQRPNWDDSEVSYTSSYSFDLNIAIYPAMIFNYLRFFFRFAIRIMN